MADFETVRAFFENRNMDDTESYLKRGRKLADLSLDDLKSLHTSELKKLIDDYERSPNGESYFDVLAEFRLRKIHYIPDDAERELVDQLRAVQDKKRAHDRAKDPEKFERDMIARSEKIEEFAKSIKGPKH